MCSSKRRSSRVRTPAARPAASWAGALLTRGQRQPHTRRQAVLWFDQRMQQPLSCITSAGRHCTAARALAHNRPNAAIISMPYCTAPTCPTCTPTKPTHAQPVNPLAIPRTFMSMPDCTTGTPTTLYSSKNCSLNVMAMKADLELLMLRSTSCMEAAEGIQKMWVGVKVGGGEGGEGVGVWAGGGVLALEGAAHAACSPARGRPPQAAQCWCLQQQHGRESISVLALLCCDPAAAAGELTNFGEALQPMLKLADLAPAQRKLQTHGALLISDLF